MMEVLERTEEDQMITADTARTIIDQAKQNGTSITITLKDAETPQTGDPISVNSKGVNIRVDGKTRSFSLRRIDVITQNIDTPADMFSDDRTYSTAELAAALEVTAKELRVHLRRIGAGVGRGKVYGFDAQSARDIVSTLRDRI